MFTPSEQWGTWVGALSQLLTALALLHFSIRSSKAAALKSLNDMFNSWNQMSASSDEFHTALKSLRDDVLDPHVDALVFSYLNILSAYFEMRGQGLVAAEEERATFANGIAMLDNIPHEKIEEYLSRGYSDAFRERVLKDTKHRPRSRKAQLVASPQQKSGHGG
jgi:hypothetical protein